MDVISFGAGLAFLCRSDRFHRLTAPLAPLSGWLLITTCLGLVASARLAHRFDHYDSLCHRTITGLLCSSLIYLSIAYPNRPIWRVLESRPLVAAGAVSYGIYLWHQLFTGRSGLPSWMVTWPTNVFWITSAVIVSYFMIERPFLRIKDRKVMACRPDEPSPPTADTQLASMVLARS